jgi:hypothetical protein
MLDGRVPRGRHDLAGSDSTRLERLMVLAILAMRKIMSMSYLIGYNDDAEEANGLGD